MWGNQTDRTTANRHRTTRAAAIKVLALAVMLLVAVFLGGCAAGSGSAEGNSDTGTQDQTVQNSAEGTTGSFMPHGSTYEKSETVAVATDFSGTQTAISVSEWIKNPEELETIVDESTLQAIAATKDEEGKRASFEQTGEEIVWQAAGADISYTGVIDKELPFKISYSFKLDDEELDPSKLTNLDGKLEVSIHYENLTHDQVSVNGTTHNIQIPYLMASMISLDSKHAQNVTVEGGSVMDQNGSFVVIGIAAPGLASTLGLEDMLDLPDTVTLKADVRGFDMPDIRTIVTDQALAMVGDSTLDEADTHIDALFGQVDTIESALSALEQGTAGMSQAMTQINEGLAKLNTAFPQATSGLDGLKQGADGVNGLLTQSNAALAQAKQSQASAKEALLSIDTSALDADQAAALETARAKLDAADANMSAAIQGTQQAQGASAQLSAGLEKVQEGLTQIQTGYENLGSASGKVREVADKLTAAVSTMSEGIDAALSQMKGSIDDEFALIRAIRDRVQSQGAFAGSSDAMSASTLFTVTASAA